MRRRSGSGRFGRFGWARLLALAALPISLLLTPSPVSAQALGAVSVSDPLDDYLRVLEIARGARTGSSLLRPLLPSTEWLGTLGPHPWFERVGRLGGGGRAGAPGVDASAGPDAGFTLHPTGARLRLFANTRHPFGQNDGPVWQGKGLTTALEGGVVLRWRGLSARIEPALTYAQNADFELAPANWAVLPPVAYPWRVIDLPQRPGSEPVTALHPGESELRADLRGVTLGLSTRNLWWGPGVRNAILLSDHAAGFPHAFVGTRRPLDLGFGTLDALYLHGTLSSSDWFDPALADRSRFLTGLALVLSPEWPRGASVGAARMFYGWIPESGRTLRSVLLPLAGFRKVSQVTPENPLGDDEEDQILSLFLRWALPESGFEVYAEWARTDHSWDIRDLVLEPEHSEARTLGVRHATDLSGDRILLLGIEVTDLAKGTTTRVRVVPTYYEHWIVTPGYTHEGQVVGAGIGPGGSAQSISLDLFAPWGGAGLLLERQVRDNDAYYVYAEASGSAQCCHDVLLNAGPRGTLFVGDLDLEGELTLSREMNRDFRPYEDVWNLNLALSARWRPR